MYAKNELFSGFIYDARTEQSTHLPNNMPAARVGFIAPSIDYYMYVIGGREGELMGELWIPCIGSRWKPTNRSLWRRWGLHGIKCCRAVRWLARQQIDTVQSQSAPLLSIRKFPTRADTRYSRLANQYPTRLQSRTNSTHYSQDRTKPEQLVYR